MSFIDDWVDKLRNLFRGEPKGRRKEPDLSSGGSGSNDRRKMWIGHAVSRLDEGDLSVLPTVYSGLVNSEPADVQRCAAAIRRTLEPWLVGARLEGMKKIFQQYTSLLWFGDWRQVSPGDFEFRIDDQDDLFAVLALGSFHPCGYFREKCLVRLESFGGRSLPPVILAINNWVETVRRKAFEISGRLINSASLDEVLAALGILEKVRRGERRNAADLQTLLQLAAARIKARSADLSPEMILRLDNSARRLAGPIILFGRLLSETDELRLLRGEPDPANQRRLAEPLLARDTVSAEILDYLRQSRSAALRLDLLKHWPKWSDRPMADLESFIFDAQVGVREYARFLLRKNGVTDFASKYRLAVGTNLSVGAVAGLGETGEPEDAALVEPLLNSGRPALIKAALTALAALKGQDCAETLLKFLTEPASGGRAYFLALKLKLVLPSAQLYEAFFKTEQPAARARLARVISRQDRWDQLPYLIKLLPAAEGELRNWIERQLLDWAPAYTRPYPSQLEIITQTLAAENIPSDVRKNLELTLKALDLI